MVIAAVFALAVIGTAGAFGYRALFGSSRDLPPAAGHQGRYRAEQDRAGVGEQDAWQADHRSGRRSRAGRKDRVARRAAGRDKRIVRPCNAGAAGASQRPGGRRLRRHSAVGSSPASRRKSTPSPSVPISRAADSQPVTARSRAAGSGARQAGTARRRKLPAILLPWPARRPPSPPPRPWMRAPLRRCIRPRRRRPAMRRSR